MLRAIAAILLFSGGWATIQALAFWKTAPDDETVTVKEKQTTRQPSAIGVPVELAWSSRWARVTDASNEPRETRSERQGDPQAPMQLASAEPGDEAIRTSGKDMSKLVAAPESPRQSMTLAPLPAENKPEGTVAEAADDVPPTERLAAAIQTELKKLGHYTGEIDNVWGSRSRAAVRAFNREQDADLPQTPVAEVYQAVRGALADEAPGGSKPQHAGEPVMLNQQTALAGQAGYLPPWLKDGRKPKSDETARAGSGGEARVEPVALPRPDLRPARKRVQDSKVESERSPRSAPQRSLKNHLKNAGFYWPGQ